MLTQIGNHWLTPSRFLKYRAVLTESKDVSIQATNILHPAAYLQGKVTEAPVQHDCIETMEAVYSSRPDLNDSPLENADDWFRDGRSYVKNGKRFAGYAVTTTDAVIEANPLRVGTSAQKAEVIALTRALALAEGNPINIWTGSRYAFGVIHAHGAIWKRKEFINLTEETHQARY